ncbi:hypothetical protein [Leptospira bandrabouensis]|uniref:Uncharacterized protein n=1 Tax=Leptospira bandrabouensis TaxID=2484903 RepID=A0A6H3NTW7_9LEPT|nr:hypothetical protein [Leptospira bandrabouensis]MCG6151129.1 hypothetical protein [Leptospira bandrabouensis]MCW7457345.1 hypothetical protein [Leptospira bandrabouensis]MCW7476381.1 hypothetical protein [Leptospira bandrabouensis]MCW7484064.1 hypothetical protein [Leptospira bandrabouensis]TGN05078.1 hypothetical protein EHR07_10735 [Leptospira bandrabouensis]
MNQYETILNQVIGEYKNLFGKAANVTIPFEGQKKIQKNIRLFDWFQISKNKKIEFYDRFGDIDEENVLGKYIIDNGDDEIFSPELREGVVPFAYIVDDGATGNDYQEEGILMLDLRDAKRPVLIAEVDGTIDGQTPFTMVSFASLNLKSGKIKVED